MIISMRALILTSLLFALRTRRVLVLENLALRHQLAVLQHTALRPRLQTSDRLLRVLLSRRWSSWKDTICIVQPATVTRCGSGPASRSSGPGRAAGMDRAARPFAEVQALIRQMSKANPLWSAPRIHGEL